MCKKVKLSLELGHEKEKSSLELGNREEKLSLELGYSRKYEVHSDDRTPC